MQGGNESTSETNVKKIIAAIAILVALGALSYFSLVKDGFAVRTELAGYFAVATSNKLDLSHVDEWNKEAKDKYGPGASTAIRGQNWETYVGGRVVETKAMESTVFSTYGVFGVSRKSSVLGIFPFEVSTDPKYIPDPEFTARRIKDNFTGKIPARVLEFDDQEWRIAHCHSPEPVAFGLPFSRLRLGATDVCLIRLNAEGSGTMVIGYAVIDGGTWIRPFARRLCRTLSATWVESMMSRPNVKRPDYVGSLLTNKSSEGLKKSDEFLSSHFFEVRDDKTLAVFN